MQQKRIVEAVLMVIAMVCAFNAFTSPLTSTFKIMAITGYSCTAALCIWYIASLKSSPFNLAALLLLIHAFVGILPWFEVNVELWMYYAGYVGFPVYALLVLVTMLRNKAIFKEQDMFFYGLIAGLIFQIAFRFAPDETDTFYKIAANLNYLIVGVIGTIRLSNEVPKKYPPGVTEIMNIVLIFSFTELLTSISNAFF